MTKERMTALCDELIKIASSYRDLAITYRTPFLEEYEQCMRLCYGRTVGITQVKLKLTEEWDNDTGDET